MQGPTKRHIYDIDQTKGTFTISVLEVIKLFFMLNSTEYDFFLLINVEMPTIVGILKFMTWKNSIFGLSEPKKAEFLDIFILMSI